MFLPAGNHLDKHIWTLLLSVFSTDIWGTGSQKRLPHCFFFLLSCNTWHPDGTSGKKASPIRSSSGKSTPSSWLAGIIADSWKKSTNAIQEMAARKSWNDNVYCCTTWSVQVLCTNTGLRQSLLAFICCHRRLLFLSISPKFIFICNK